MADKNLRKLTDVELKDVNGGMGSWEYGRETCTFNRYKDSGSSLSFEDWLLANGFTPDSVKARGLWIQLPGESRRYTRMMVDGDASWTVDITPKDSWCM